MKRILIVLSVVLTLVIGTAVAYADSNLSAMNSPWRYNNKLSEQSKEELIKDRAEFRENEIEKALENGTINEAEAKEWDEHFNYMDEFHNKNGHLHGDRGCHGMMRAK